MEKKNIFLWIVLCIAIAGAFLTILGLWMFYVIPTIWFFDAAHETGWIMTATILVRLGISAFILVVTSILIIKILYWKKNE
jgi:hypothetical protein